MEFQLRARIFLASRARVRVKVKVRYVCLTPWTIRVRVTVRVPAQSREFLANPYVINRQNHHWPSQSHREQRNPAGVRE